MATPNLAALKLSYSCCIGDITPDQLQAVMHDVKTTDPGTNFQWTLIAPIPLSSPKTEQVDGARTANSTITSSDITPNLYQGPQFCATVAQQEPVQGEYPKWPLGVTNDMGTVPTVFAEIFWFGPSLTDVSRLEESVTQAIQKNLCRSDQSVWVMVSARQFTCTGIGVPKTPQH